VQQRCRFVVLAGGELLLCVSEALGDIVIHDAAVRRNTASRPRTEEPIVREPLAFPLL
jgi:hypothetical protein